MNEMSFSEIHRTNLLCPILLEDENPETAREEEEDGEHLVEGRQGHLPAKKHDERTFDLEDYPAER